MTDLLTVAECAAVAGISPSTWRAYVSRGQAPQPVKRYGNTPLWDRAVIEAWQNKRGKA